VKRGTLSLIAVMFLCVAVAPSAAGAKQSINLLWLGNSFTGLGELYNLEKEIINTCDTSLNVVSSYCKPLWGQGLDAQYNDAQVMDSVRSGRYRYVVVQGYLNSGASEFKTTMVQMTLQYGVLIINEIKAAGSVPIVFLHQVNQGSTADRWDTLISTYAKLADSTGAKLAPCGIAWRRAITERPDMNFWGTADGSDNHHQGSYGVYLNACVFYMVMTGKSPVGISVTHAKRIDTGAYRDFTPDTALMLQQYAYATVDSCMRAGATAAGPQTHRAETTVSARHAARAIVVSRPRSGRWGAATYTLQGASLPKSAVCPLGVLVIDPR
jgi:hypothetical protein